MLREFRESKSNFLITNQQEGFFQLIINQKFSFIFETCFYCLKLKAKR